MISSTDKRDNTKLKMKKIQKLESQFRDLVTQLNIELTPFITQTVAITMQHSDGSRSNLGAIRVGIHLSFHLRDTTRVGKHSPFIAPQGAGAHNPQPHLNLHQGLKHNTGRNKFIFDTPSPNRWATELGPTVTPQSP